MGGRRRLGTAVRSSLRSRRQARRNLGYYKYKKYGKKKKGYYGDGYSKKKKYSDDGYSKKKKGKYYYKKSKKSSGSGSGSANANVQTNTVTVPCEAAPTAAPST